MAGDSLLPRRKVTEGESPCKFVGNEFIETPERLLGTESQKRALDRAQTPREIGGGGIILRQLKWDS